MHRALRIAVLFTVLLAAYATAQTGSGAKGDAERIVGVWVVISGEREGEKKPIEPGRNPRMVFNPKQVFFRDSQRTDRGSYKLGPNERPREMDITMQDGTSKCIYELDGDTLKVCLAAPGRDRPKDFTSKRGVPNFLIHLKRETGPAAEREMQELAAAAAREGGPEMEQCKKQMKHIVLALHNYHDTQGRFPAPAIYAKDGKALLSWRVAILPYLEHDNLYRRFKLDEAWDSPTNKPLMKEMPDVYARPGKADGPTLTPFQGFVGKGTAFEGPKGIGIASITDGTSNTAFFVEASKAVPWSKPDDLPYDPAKPLPELGGVDKGGFFLAWMDGSVDFIKKPIEEKLLRLAITRQDGMILDRGKLVR
jgi:uncharacterized protein (TIGR03067 family)